MNNYDADHWDALANDLEQTVDTAWEQLKALPDEATLARPYSGAWSVKEILGHLIDSAANNHQRFVRLQVGDDLVLPDYSQDNDAWVSIQRYQESSWAELLQLWRHFNLHLARIIRKVNPHCLDHQWLMNENQRFRLDELMIDYPKHLKEHLQQIRHRLEEDGFVSKP